MSKTLTYYRTYLVRALIIICMVVTLASWYFVSPPIDAIANELSIWNMNISTFTLFVGLATILSRYVEGIRNRSENWLLMIYGTVLIVVWVIFGTITGIYADVYQIAFLSTKITLHIAILGQLIFFMTSAAYRLFRIRTFRTALYALCTLVLVLCNSPLLLGPFPIVDKISFWLMNNPSMAGSRALMLTGGIGGAVLGIRILLGLEKGALRATEEL
jgi:hypothetical protein